MTQAPATRRKFAKLDQDEPEECYDTDTVNFAPAPDWDTIMADYYQECSTERLAELLRLTTGDKTRAILEAEATRRGIFGDRYHG